VAHQEIWAWLIAHYAIAVLIARAAEAADTDRISFIRVLRLVRRSITGTADIFPLDWADAQPDFWTDITTRLNPPHRHRTCPHAIKRQRHNSYRSKKRGEPASIRHDRPATTRIYPLTPQAA